MSIIKTVIVLPVPEEKLFFSEFIAEDIIFVADAKG